MDAVTAQAELRYSYVNGGPGAVVSGLVWLAAAITATNTDVTRGFTVLFFAGMGIFPVGTLVIRTFFRRRTPSRENTSGRTVIETVFPMLGGFLAAWLLLPARPDLVFPLAAVAVGAHYFGFRTAYGAAIYWVLATVMCAVGLATIFTGVPTSSAVPYLIAAIEVAFGLWLTWTGRAQPDPLL